MNDDPTSGRLEPAKAWPDHEVGARNIRVKCVKAAIDLVGVPDLVVGEVQGPGTGNLLRVASYIEDGIITDSVR